MPGARNTPGHAFFSIKAVCVLYDRPPAWLWYCGSVLGERRESSPFRALLQLNFSCKSTSFLQVCKALQKKIFKPKKRDISDQQKLFYVMQMSHFYIRVDFCLIFVHIAQKIYNILQLLLDYQLIFFICTFGQSFMKCSSMGEFCLFSATTYISHPGQRNMISLKSYSRLFSSRYLYNMIFDFDLSFCRMISFITHSMPSMTKIDIIHQNTICIIISFH